MKWFPCLHSLMKTLGRLGEHSISWKPLRFASWFPTLILCSPNLPRVYIRLCKHGNHFTFLHWTSGEAVSGTSTPSMFLFFLFKASPIRMLGNQSFNHILCLKWRTFILCIIQDGSTHVDFFQVKGIIDLKSWKSLQLLTTNCWPQFHIRGKHTECLSKTLY